VLTALVATLRKRNPTLKKGMEFTPTSITKWCFLFTKIKFNCIINTRTGGNMKFNSENLDVLRSQLDKIFKVFGENNEIEFKIGRISYTDGYCNIGLKAYSTENTGPANVTGKELEFFNNAVRLGVPNNWLNKKVTINGSEYIISGLNTSARKFPVILSAIDGSGPGMKSTIESIRQKLS